tara:strand:+ start:12176 stop:12319 length:144 start_codon:yes stop_codon:yes gene_type:complete
MMGLIIFILSAQTLLPYQSLRKSASASLRGTLLWQAYFHANVPDYQA